MKTVNINLNAIELDKLYDVLTVAGISLEDLLTSFTRDLVTYPDGTAHDFLEESKDPLRVRPDFVPWLLMHGHMSLALIEMENADDATARALYAMNHPDDGQIDIIAEEKAIKDNALAEIQKLVSRYTQDIGRELTLADALMAISHYRRDKDDFLGYDE